MAGVAKNLGASDATLVGVRSIYKGVTVSETGGGVAHLRIRDGASGVILDTIKLAAGQSVSTWYGPEGLHVFTGIYEEHVTGTYEGAVRYQ